MGGCLAWWYISGTLLWLIDSNLWLPDHGVASLTPNRPSAPVNILAAVAVVVVMQLADVVLVGCSVSRVWHI